MRRSSIEELTVRCHSTVCQHRHVPSTIYSITAESLKWAARQPTGFRALPLWLPRKRAYNQPTLFQALNPPSPKHSSYLSGRGPHRGQFLSTPPMEPSDGIRAYGAHSGSSQTEIQWMGGILQNALCKRHGIQEMKRVLKGLPPKSAESLSKAKCLWQEWAMNAHLTASQRCTKRSGLFLSTSKRLSSPI